MNGKTKNTLYGYIIILIISITVNTFCHAQEADSIALKMMPEIPSGITKPAQRAEYLALHYWDKYDFNDTTFLMKDNRLEHSFVDFIDVLSLVPDSCVADIAVNTLMTKTENIRSMFVLLSKLSEHYLYETDSPVHNEEKLIPFLKCELELNILDDTEKIRPKFLLDNISKNRIGKTANDVKYTTVDGQTGTLYSLKFDYVILYFNDPECDECETFTKQLIFSPEINKLISEGKLKILTVYVNDDIETWKEHASKVLNSWIYARDAEQKINTESIYNIRQFPTVYLLDKDKKVLLKDTTFEQIENYFNQ